MKIFFNIPVILLMILSSAEAQKPRVVSSASMIWDMAKQIGGDKVINELIVPIGGDPHLYDPTPRDARLVASADHIFVNGLTFEGWVLELIKNSGTKAEIDTVTNGVRPISSEIYKDSFDPHAWMDVSNAIIYIENIRDALVRLDPENASYYRENHSIYKKKLEELDAYILKRIQEIPEGRRVLITSHDAFKYYGNRYGLRLEAIVGISTEAEAQTSDIVRISNTIKETGVPAIFIESTINPKLIEQVARDHNISIGGKLFADSIGDENSPAPTYYDMLKHNTDTIVDALKGESDGVEKEGGSGPGYLGYAVIAIIFIIGLFFMIKKLNK